MTINRLGLILSFSLFNATLAYTQVVAPHPRHTKHISKRPTVATVLVCGSRSAYAYHSYECHGLNRCRSEVSRVSLSEARSMGYVPCKICH